MLTGLLTWAKQDLVVLVLVLGTLLLYTVSALGSPERRDTHSSPGCSSLVVLLPPCRQFSSVVHRDRGGQSRALYCKDSSHISHGTKQPLTIADTGVPRRRSYGFVCSRDKHGSLFAVWRLFSSYCQQCQGRRRQRLNGLATSSRGRGTSGAGRSR